MITIKIVMDNKIKSIPEDLLDLWNEEEEMDAVPTFKKDDLFNDELWDHQW